MKKATYCNSLTKYERFKTREVMIGQVGIGGNNPIRLQSMTTTDTMDTEATVEQSIRMIEAGCEIVRITAQVKKMLKIFKTSKMNYVKEDMKPLVADIPLHQMLLKLLLESLKRCVNLVIMLIKSALNTSNIQMTPIKKN